MLEGCRPLAFETLESLVTHHPLSLPPEAFKAAPSATASAQTGRTARTERSTRGCRREADDRGCGRCAGGGVHPVFFPENSHSKHSMQLALDRVFSLTRKPDTWAVEQPSNGPSRLLIQEIRRDADGFHGSCRAKRLRVGLVMERNSTS